MFFLYRLKYFYRLSMPKVALTLIGILILWTVLQYYFDKSIGWKFVNVILLPVTVAIILSLTIIGRNVSETHILVTAYADSPEFLREMIMNVALFLPFGLVFCTLIGPWSIFEGLVLSVAIEYVQYYYGMGVAQVTDVLMNTLGCILGTVPFVIVKIYRWKKGRTKASSKVSAKST